MNISFQRFFLGLVLLTLLALYAHANWMSKTLRLDAYSQFTVSVTDDRPEGGKSIAVLEHPKNAYAMRCEIRAGYQWPFCELDIRFSANDQGVDLSHFDTLRLAVRVSGPEPQQSLRVFLRNFDPGYSKPNDGASLKPHEVVYDPTAQAGPVEFKLSQFMVASWWVQEHPTSVKYLGPQLDHVTTIAFATGGNVMPGPHEIIVETAELRGLWVSAENFRLGIIFVWLFSILSYLFMQWKKSRLDLDKSDQQRRELYLSNEALELRVAERTRALSSSNISLIETLQNLDGARKELVQSEKNAALGSLVAGIAHELNTPIGNAVLISSTMVDASKEFSEMTKLGLTRKALDNYVADITRGTEILSQNLARAVTLISSFKQLSADQYSEQRRIFSLAQVVEETQLVMAPRIRQTAHQLTIEVPPDLIMDSYPGPLSQVIMNFINNSLLHAFDGISHGHMRLQARLLATDQIGGDKVESDKLESDKLEIRFTDDGLGISAHVLSHVFEPFFTTKLGKGGSGLGMNLAYNVVTKLLGGKIEIHSTLGQGATIRMELPLQAPLPSEQLARIGIPTDVMDDYHQFMDGRTPNEISHFSGAYSRRDVVELALFMREMQNRLPDLAIDLVAIDNYAVGIEQVRAGKISALASSCWLADLKPFLEDVLISDAIVQEEESRVGLFCLATNKAALALNTVEDLRKLKVVSNSDWSADWQTLSDLGIKRCVDVKTWRQMVYMVSCDEVDVLLAPFPSHHQLSIALDGCSLVPVKGQVIVLRGSRHLVAARDHVGLQIAETVFPALRALVQDGSVTKAFTECGFLNEETASWNILGSSQTGNL
ncbi:MAG: HAMP domain-containing sensor histidine kinase [Pseudomonadota bacterium]